MAGMADEELTIADVPGIRIGHWSDADARTGCTAVLCDPGGAVASVEVRGSAPGTRETDLLQPGRLVERVNAIMLCGGSAFGLAAATGAMRWLAERGIGYGTAGTLVPIVPAAVLFDLAVGSPDAFPDESAGYAACEAATHPGGPVAGRVGAGTGATFGKLGGQPLPGGVGTAALRVPGGATIGALAAVNALGDVVADDGVLVGPPGVDLDGRVPAVRRLLSGDPIPDPGAANTTLVIVATDARLDKAGCRNLARIAHDGFARAIRPVHTIFDGDTAFALSTGELDVDPLVLATAAVEVVATAIRRAATIPISA